jgi:diaminopropionate ammonia-lyase
MTSPSYAHIYEFHRAFFPGHPPTQLIRLDGLEQTLGVDAVYLKDESTRFGLPAFKILGASWGLIAALSRRYNVDHMDFDAIGKMAQEEGLTVYAATDGTHRLE